MTPDPDPINFHLDPDIIKSALAEATEPLITRLDAQQRLLDAMMEMRRDTASRNVRPRARENVDAFLTVAQTAWELKLSTRQVHYMARDGRLKKHYPDGVRRPLFKLSEVRGCVVRPQKRQK